MPKENNYKPVSYLSSGSLLKFVTTNKNLPAASTSSGIVATQPSTVVVMNRKTPQAHRAPTPSDDSADFSETSISSRTETPTPHHAASPATTTGLTTSEDPAEVL
ncbi:hypothetical protein JOB18_004457 [Solea senegalensis]|uniref:Uncharacterized protein n=1 Tax=Solea senegalensis TaxID=28829 RepID=A0AAV6QMI5_SOLSE|nr:hypothetical protein JOB18_004457 [Solea senegalensis]